ncbi:hypothetical protein ABZS71_10065 [Streptomyces sp. NPDC005393]|uniref:hypothetical protein n=1 Tax=Streptomyces sp. NPDC005393 TaxID=3157041 RepID=UPI0033A28B11
MEPLRADDPRRIGPYDAVARFATEDGGRVPVPERRFLARLPGGNRTVVISMPLPGADVGRFAYAASGERAYDGGHVAAVQYEMVHGEPNLSQVPEPVRALVAPCLAEDPAHRPLPQQVEAAFAPPPGTRRGAKAVWRLGGLAADIKRRDSAAWPSVAGDGREVARCVVGAANDGGGERLAGVLDSAMPLHVARGRGGRVSPRGSGRPGLRGRAGSAVCRRPSRG